MSGVSEGEAAGGRGTFGSGAKIADVAGFFGSFAGERRGGYSGVLRDIRDRLG